MPAKPRVTPCGYCGGDVTVARGEYRRGPAGPVHHRCYQLLQARRPHAHEWMHTLGGAILCRICRAEYPEPPELADVHFSDCAADCPGHPQPKLPAAPPVTVMGCSRADMEVM